MLHSLVRIFLSCTTCNLSVCAFSDNNLHMLSTNSSITGARHCWETCFRQYGQSRFFFIHSLRQWAQNTWLQLVTVACKTNKNIFCRIQFSWTHNRFGYASEINVNTNFYENFLANATLEFVFQRFRHPITKLLRSNTAVFSNKIVTCEESRKFISSFV